MSRTQVEAAKKRRDGTTKARRTAATKNEWLGLLDVAGLELEALYGSFDKGPLTADSREHIFVAARR